MGLNPYVEQVGGDVGDSDGVVEFVRVEKAGVCKRAGEGCKEGGAEFGDGSGGSRKDLGGRRWWQW